MSEALVSLLLLAGVAFILLGAIGLLRMPDFYMRMHANSKPATLGVLFVFAAVALHFGDLGTGMHAFLVVVFFIVTAPVASHRIGRAAWRTGVPMHAGTVLEPGLAPKPESPPLPAPQVEP